MSTTQEVWISATGVQHGNQLRTGLSLMKLGNERRNFQSSLKVQDTRLVSFLSADVQLKAVGVNGQPPALTAESVVKNFEFFKPSGIFTVPLVRVRRVAAELERPLQEGLSLQAEIADLRILGRKIEVTFSPNAAAPVNGQAGTLVESIRWRGTTGPTIGLGSGLTGTIEGKNHVLVRRDDQLVADIRLAVVYDPHHDLESSNGGGINLAAAAEADALSGAASSGPTDAPSHAGLTMLEIRARVDPETGELQPIEGDAFPDATTTSVGDVKSDGADPGGNP